MGTKRKILLREDNNLEKEIANVVRRETYASINPQEKASALAKRRTKEVAMYSTVVSDEKACALAKRRERYAQKRATTTPEEKAIALAKRRKRYAEAKKEKQQRDLTGVVHRLDSLSKNNIITDCIETAENPSATKEKRENQAETNHEKGWSGETAHANLDFDIFHGEHLDRRSHRGKESCVKQSLLLQQINPSSLPYSSTSRTRYPSRKDGNIISGSSVFREGEKVCVISGHLSFRRGHFLSEPLVYGSSIHQSPTAITYTNGEHSCTANDPLGMSNAPEPSKENNTSGILGCGLSEGQLPSADRLRVYDIRNIPTKPFALKKPTSCSLCGALLFQGESLSFCCSQGEVTIPYNEPPAPLWKMFVSDEPQPKAFQRFTRPYNNLFALTSLGLTYDETLANALGTGVYTFRVQGQIYHFINRLLPEGDQPTHMQLYYYDPNHEVENRARILDFSDSAIIKTLSAITASNPYCAFFKSLRDIPNLASSTIVIKSNPQLNQTVYNKPSVSDVAFIWTDDEDASKIKERDIVVYGHSNESHRVNYYFGCYDPLQYPLLFPNGESGWHPQIHRCAKLKGKHLCKGMSDVEPSRFSHVDDLIAREKRAMRAMKEDRSTYISIREYYAFMFQIRPGKKNLPLAARRLLQQFCVDMYIKLESSRLDFFRLNQDLIRAELYQGLVEALVIGETEAARVGKRIILPGSFIGGPRDMRRRYLDAMALVCKFGKPDIFLTMTCNADWPDIVDHLEFGQTAQDRPDLVARVFKAKLRQLKHEVLKMHIFGRVIAHVYVVEFQKRGLPHVHMLLILDNTAKLTTPASYDKIVSAELPDPEKQPYLFSLVKRHMMHGPCGVLNKSNICMQDNGQCRSRYPKAYQEHTRIGLNEYPLYRRKNNGRTVDVRRHSLDNRWVVPYNPYLLAKFDCHLNVEICSTIKAVKYLYKYIYKGHDRVAFCLTSEDNHPAVNEIDAFQKGRWVAPPEAMWRIFGYSMYSMKPSVMTLQLHLENMQNVVFRPIGKVKSIVENENSSKTTLTEFFQMNKESYLAKSLNLLYADFPAHFTWNQTTKSWKPRKIQTSIGRISNVCPTEGEKYYLRRLLTNVRGPTSYIDLKTVNNVVYPTFREAAQARGLVQEDDMVDSCLQESEVYQMPSAIRNMFAILLVYCNPPNVLQLWNKYLPSMSEDFLRGNGGDTEKARSEVLLIIQKNLESKGKSLENYGLPNPNISALNRRRYKEVEDEEALLPEINDLMSVELLNEQQKNVYDRVMEKVHSNQPGVFFVDGPGGTGKTFVYKAIIATVRFEKQIALATATSGVAVSLLPGGRTAHSRFKIPIDSDMNIACNVSKISGTAALLKKAKIIIWDEAAMAKKESIEAVDALLQDLHENKLPFGGKVILFGGDFRQVLPVVFKGGKEDLISASLVKSYVWKHLEKFHLTENMRAKLDPNYSAYLMRIGDGIEPLSYNGSIRLPRSIVIDEATHERSLSSLIDFVFPKINSEADLSEHFSASGILTPTNVAVDKLNRIMLERFPGDMKTYNSIDETVDPNQQGQYEDLLHSFLPNGMPPHELMLKLNCPAMILRNIDPANGLCNGTRVICRAFHKNMIFVEIAVGDRKGEKAMIPRIPMFPPSNEQFPVSFKRIQFPIRPSFAMTINKAQGQTLSVVGLYLPQPVFSHGQLYVALSRVKLMSTIKVFAAHALEDGTTGQETRNVVYQEILDLAKMPLSYSIWMIRIQDLQNNDSDWTMNVIVLEHSYIRLSQTGTSTYKKLVLMDTQGDKIQATIFTKEMYLFRDVLFPFRQYNISNASVTTIPERFQMFETPFQMTIGKRTIVEETEEGDFTNLPLINAEPFSDLYKFIDSDENFDMLFIVAIALPTRQVMSKGEPATIQEFIVIDEELIPVKLTFWDEMAKNEGADVVAAKYEGPTILTVNRIRATTFEGFSLAARQSAAIAINPQLLRARDLHEWYMANSEKANQTANQCLAKRYRSIIPTMKPKIIIPLKDVAQKSKQETYLWVNCSMTVQDKHQDFFDIICDNCEAPVTALAGRRFRCNSCKKTTTAIPSARIMVRLTDDTGSLTAEISKDLAEFAFMTSAHDMMENKKEHGILNTDKFPAFANDEKVSVLIYSFVARQRGIPSRRYFVYHVDGYVQPGLLQLVSPTGEKSNPLTADSSLKGKEIVGFESSHFSSKETEAETNQDHTDTFPETTNADASTQSSDITNPQISSPSHADIDKEISPAKTLPSASDLLLAPALVTPEKREVEKRIIAQSKMKRKLEQSFPADDDISIDQAKSTPIPGKVNAEESKKLIPPHLIKKEKN